MKIVPKPAARPLEMKRVDYPLLAVYYNLCELGDAVELDKVSNVALFKKSLGRLGITSDVDFHAFTKDGKTYVKRLTPVRMAKD